MTWFTNGPLPQLMAITLFAVIGLAPTNPMAKFVDCSDSFWAVACGLDADPEPLVVPEGFFQIDNDPVCVTIDGGFIVCHT